MSDQKTITMSLVAFICVSLVGIAIAVGFIYSAMSLNSLQENYDTLSAEHEFVKSEVSNLSGINAELSDENASLSEENAGLVAETERLAQENANLRLAAETNLDLGMDVDIDALLEDALNP